MVGTSFEYGQAHDPYLRLIFSRIDTALLSIVAGTLTDNSLTNAKLATDIKIGSLASLTTTTKASVQAAINELDAGKYEKPESGIPSSDMATAVQTSLGLADSAYQLPVDGVPSSDMTTAVQTSLGLADSALQQTATITKILSAVVQLNGYAKTCIGFQSDTAGYIDGGAGPYDLHTVGHGGTILVAADALGDETATLECVAGYHTGAVGASTDMSAEVDDKFKISVDGGDPVEVECDFSGEVCDTGDKIATEMQTKIQAALSGVLVTVAYSAVGGDHYTITSPTLGTDSSIAITPADDHNCTEELKLGTAEGGADTAGTGDCGDVTAVSVDEIVTLLTGDCSNVTASNNSGSLRITSKTTGRLSRVIAGDGTLNTALGIPNTETGYGKIGLGESADMDDASYTVQVSLGGSGATDQTIAWDARATDGFDLVALTDTSAEDYVTVTVMGVQAS